MFHRLEQEGDVRPELMEVGRSVLLDPPYGASRVGRGWQLRPIGASRPIPSNPSLTCPGSAGQTGGSASSEPSDQGRAQSDGVTRCRSRIGRADPKMSMLDVVGVSLHVIPISRFNELFAMN